MSSMTAETENTQSSTPGWLNFVFGAGPLDKLSDRIAWIVGAVLLLPRLWLADAFFAAGWTRYQNWSSQEFLFTAQHPLPLPVIGGILPGFIATPHESGIMIMQPVLAAYVTTIAEWLLPALLVLGLLGRWAALGLAIMAATILFLVAGVPAHSFGFDPANLANAAEQGPWIIVGLALFVVGSGRLSVDTLIRRSLSRHG